MVLLMGLQRARPRGRGSGWPVWLSAAQLPGADRRKPWQGGCSCRIRQGTKCNTEVNPRNQNSAHWCLLSDNVDPEGIAHSMLGCPDYQLTAAPVYVPSSAAACVARLTTAASYIVLQNHAKL